jgi:hypothetical protein
MIECGFFFAIRGEGIHDIFSSLVKKVKCPVIYLR